MKWRSLFTKEWQATQFSYLLNLAGITAIYVFMYSFMERFPPLVFLFGMAMIVAHVIYMLVEVPSSLNKEWKQNTVHVWLNFPIAGWKLLSAKFIVTFIQFGFSLVYLMIVVYFFIVKARTILEQSGQSEMLTEITLMKELYVQFSPLIFVFVSYGAILLGLVGLFLFLIAKMIRFGWILGIGIVVVFNYGLNWLRETAIYTTVTEWGLLVNIKDLPAGFSFEGDSESIMVELGNELLVQIYTGQILVEMLLIVGIFLFLSWIFDHKLQV
ncbi:hypothetical protein ACM26V_07320 [Salipaludibacillus sp. HK11]|uniref:hypothetical protein n=1 Tax=Salipaludibacillus sp. HK11 TaxID=3394320 RepID=UPI0039FD660C